jgi:hypothetical protein
MNKSRGRLDPTSSVGAVSNVVRSGCGPLIGTLNEGSLHAALKQYYSLPGDAFEVPFDRFVIDIVRDQGTASELLIEIQTGAFAAMGAKLDRLLTNHRLLLVHPIAFRTILDRPDSKPRRSPKRGSIYNLFDELVSIPTLLDHPNLQLDVVLVSTAKTQVHDPKVRRGRGGWRTVDRRLDEVLGVERFNDVAALGRLLPDTLPKPFTTADIADRAGISRDLAQKLAYCFRAVHLIDEIGRSRDGKCYRLSS